MPEIQLVAEAGRPTGSAAAGRLRAEGKIPGVVYGHGIEPLPVAVEGRALRTALTGEAGLNALLDLQVDGTSHLTMAKDIQRHPVKHTVTHVDFLIVRRDEIVSVDVTINLVGDAEEVHRGDGVVAQELFSVLVHTTPGRIPASIDVDVSALQIGDAIRVADLKLPEGVTTELDPEAAVVVGQPPQVSEADLITEEEAAAAAEAASEEAAAEGEGEGAEGAAPEGGGEGGGESSGSDEG
jgi:large subunit ribosomal protein L25